MLEPNLTKKIAELLPQGRIEAQILPQCPEIQLYLLNADYPQHTLTPEQALRIMQEPMYWVFCWASGQAMARRLLDNPDWVAGKRVLDFGTGSGVAAIAAAKAGAKQVWASDIDPWSVAATKANCCLNRVDVEVIGDWQACAAELDLILVADVLYDRENLPLLELFLQRAPEVIVADSRVKNFTFPPYLKLDSMESYTLPDLAEFDEFRYVNFYYAHSAERSLFPALAVSS